MKMKFVLNCGLNSKTGKWFLSRYNDNFQIQDMFEIGKPYIVLKTRPRDLMKKNSYIMLF